MSHYIMVVDDDIDLREALCDALELEGYDVFAAEHGKAALDHLKSADRPCLILLDLTMPVMDGKALREAMLEDPDLAPIPVVLITAAGSQKASAVSATDVLQKPLRMDTLVEVVREHCPGAQA